MAWRPSELTELSPQLWFGRISVALKLPLWAGICVVGLIPAVALWALGIQIRIATDFTGVPIVSLPLLVLNVAYLLAASELIRVRLLRLRDYTRTLEAEPGKDGVSGLSDLKAISALWAVLLLASAIFFDPFVFGLHYSLSQSLLRLVITGYLRFIQATFLWVLSCSMYSIYRWGKLPIKLKSFTEDHTLGLSAYGKTALVFVTLYVFAVLLTFPAFVYLSQAVLVSQTIFFLLGIAVFHGPLVGLRRKLVQARREKLGWIQARHRRIMERIEAIGEGPLDPALANELIAIGSIRNDLQQIHTWPFNPGIIVRLVTVVVLPLILVLLATYLVHLFGL